MLCHEITYKFSLPLFKSEHSRDDDPLSYNVKGRRLKRGNVEKQEFFLEIALFLEKPVLLNHKDSNEKNVILETHSKIRI